MERAIYGVYYDGAHIDVSETLCRAKQYATRNGYNIVTKRVGYNAYKVAKKLNNKWESLLN